MTSSGPSPDQQPIWICVEPRTVRDHAAAHERSISGGRGAGTCVVRLSYIMTVAILFVAVGSLLFRLPALAMRPMHADEAVQAARFEELWWGPGYRYDADEFHGPTLSYATLPAVWLSRPESFAETIESTFRIVPVMFGSALDSAPGVPRRRSGQGFHRRGGGVLRVFSRHGVLQPLLHSRDAAGFLHVLGIRSGLAVRTHGARRMVPGDGCRPGNDAGDEGNSGPVVLAAGVATCSSCGTTDGTDPRPRRPRFRPAHLAAGFTAAILVAVVLLSSFGRICGGPGWNLDLRAVAEARRRGLGPCPSLVFLSPAIDWVASC